LCGRRCSCFTAFRADRRHSCSLLSLTTFLETSLIWLQIRLVFPQLTSPLSVYLPAQNENSCSIRFQVLVNCCRVWDGRNSQLFIWIYNTCRIGIHHAVGTKTRGATMTLLMRMTTTDCTTANTRSSLCYKSRTRLCNCEVVCNEVPQWNTPPIWVWQTCINRLMTSHGMSSKYRNGLTTFHAVTRVMAYCFYAPVIAQTANPASWLYRTAMLKWGNLRAYCQTAERIKPRIRSLINTVVTKIRQYPCINLLKELRLDPKASHNYHRENDEIGFNLLSLLQYMRNNIPICMSLAIFLMKGSHQPLNFFAPARRINGLFSAMDKIIPTTCLFFFELAVVNLHFRTHSRLRCNTMISMTLTWPILKYLN